MTYIKIVSCTDGMRWYKSYVGQIADYLPKYDTENEYGSREPDGYVNFILKKDGELLEYKL